MNDPKADFGSLVRQFRTNLGWSQEELASHSGLDRTYIGGVERGERNVSLMNIIKIAEALNVEPKNLFDFELL
jgi:transcriptional regulator with XRE-family HTH domain